MRTSPDPLLTRSWACAVRTVMSPEPVSRRAGPPSVSTLTSPEPLRSWAGPASPWTVMSALPVLAATSDPVGSTTSTYTCLLRPRKPTRSCGATTLIRAPSWRTWTWSASSPVTSLRVSAVSVALTVTSPAPISTYRLVGPWVSNR
ncbi:MAG: hypothetical protein R2731_10460 [Nocardioides sp.]